MMKIIWIAIIIITGVIEFITVDLVSIWFTVGAVVALISGFFGASTLVQAIVFALVSGVLVCVSQPLVKKYMRGNIVRTNADRLIGKHALVLKDIEVDAKGEVKVQGTIWSASEINNRNVEKGNHVEVLAIEGSHLVVRKI